MQLLFHAAKLPTFCESLLDFVEAFHPGAAQNTSAALREALQPMLE